MKRQLSPEHIAKMVAGRRAALQPLAERFWSKVKRAGPTECWLWQSATGWLGYGRFWHGKKIRQAHHVALEVSGIQPPDRWTTGLVVDHICKNPACVNPAHLRIVSQRENCCDLAPGSVSFKNKAKTHCKRGHEYSPENTAHYRGQRICLACKRTPANLP